MKGEMKVAPALAASSAWLAEKHKVTLTIVPSSDSVRQALSPSQVSGTFTATFRAILASFRPSAIIASTSVAATSALTGPGTISQISAMICRKLRPDFAISDGLVVTPSTMPVAASSAISLVSAVSMKNFMTRGLSLKCVITRRSLDFV